MAEKRKVLIIYTGGTIGMVEDPETGVLKPFNFDHLLGELPELKKFDYQLDTFSVDEPIDSSNMHPAFWSQLARFIYKHYHEYDGFVVLHGSDTMAYTASALSFLLENLNKPVVFTGSQLPIGMLRTDGKENLITAIEIAAAHIVGEPIVREVAIYFEYMLYRANRTFKYNAEHFDAFVSPNHPILAEAGIHINFDYNALWRGAQEDLIVREEMDTRVASLKIFPGLSKPVVDAVLGIPDIKGVVLETYGAGNTFTDRWFAEALHKANENGIVLINTTQCHGGGAVDQGAYETSVQLEKAGVLNGRDLTFEAAITKLMYLLGVFPNDVESVKREFVNNLRGEISL